MLLKRQLKKYFLLQNYTNVLTSPISNVFFKFIAHISFKSAVLNIEYSDRINDVIYEFLSWKDAY